MKQALLLTSFIISKETQRFHRILFVFFFKAEAVEQKANTWFVSPADER